MMFILFLFTAVCIIISVLLSFVEKWRLADYIYRSGQANQYHRLVSCKPGLSPVRQMIYNYFLAMVSYKYWLESIWILHWILSWCLPILFYLPFLGLSPAGTKPVAICDHWTACWCSETSFSLCFNYWLKESYNNSNNNNINVKLFTIVQIKIK